MLSKSRLCQTKQKDLGIESRRADQPESHDAVVARGGPRRPPGGASRVAAAFLLHVPSPLPRRNRWVPVSLSSPPMAAFPVFRPGRLRITLFEACSAFTRVTARAFAESLSRPSTPEASDASSPPRLLRLLPAGATVAGGDFHPLKDRAFARRTEISGLKDAWSLPISMKYYNPRLSISPSQPVRG